MFLLFVGFSGPGLLSSFFFFFFSNLFFCFVFPFLSSHLQIGVPRPPAGPIPGFSGFHCCLHHVGPLHPVPLIRVCSPYFVS